MQLYDGLRTVFCIWDRPINDGWTSQFHNRRSTYGFVLSKIYGLFLSDAEKGYSFLLCWQEKMIRIVISWLLLVRIRMKDNKNKQGFRFGLDIETISSSSQQFSKWDWNHKFLCFPLYHTCFSYLNRLFEQALEKNASVMASPGVAIWKPAGSN